MAGDTRLRLMASAYVNSAFLAEALRGNHQLRRDKSASQGGLKTEDRGRKAEGSKQKALWDARTLVGWEAPDDLGGHPGTVQRRTCLSLPVSPHNSISPVSVVS